jgi:crossover junction endodeoxyribonuclease RuvC
MGIDLSLTCTGIAFMANGVLKTHTIVSSGKADASLLERHDRMIWILASTELYAIGAKPRLVVIEGPSYGSRGGHAHDRSGLWWRVVGAMRRRSVPVVEVPPTCRAKYATGNGRAGKDEVLHAARKRWGYEGTDYNEADAVILAAMGARHLGCTKDNELPDTHLSAMEKIRWTT